MSWRDRCGPKLVDVNRAIERVNSGDTIAVAPFTVTPFTLCNALIERGRRGEISNVRVDHLASLACWTSEDLKGAFELHDNYATPANRDACHAGRMEYLPVGLWKSYSLPPGVVEHPDAFLVSVSPPNEAGYCSFGPGVWMSRTMAANAKLVIAEVHPDFIRTHGENYIHIDQIDLFVEADPDTGSPQAQPLSDEEIATVEAICTQPPTTPPHPASPHSPQAASTNAPAPAAADPPRPSTAAHQTESPRPHRPGTQLSPFPHQHCALPRPLRFPAALTLALLPQRR